MDGSFVRPASTATAGAHADTQSVMVISVDRILFVSPSDGRVTRALPGRQNDVSAIDLEEWRSWWGECPAGQMLDLADVGHWRAGVYIRPCQEWRAAVAFGRAARRSRLGSIFTWSRRQRVGTASPISTKRMAR